MSTPFSPRLLKCGLVQIDPGTGEVLRTISLQYNPDTLTRSLQVQAASSGGGQDQSEALRLKGAAIETIKLEAEIDATDQLEHASAYGGSNVGNAGGQPAAADPRQGRPYSLCLTLPPLAAVFLRFTPA